MNEPDPKSPKLSASEKEKIFTGSGPMELSKAAQTAGIANPEFDPARSINMQRWVMIGVICVLFFLLNGVVCYLINKTINLEFALLNAAKPIVENQRIITNGVFVTLIGATVVQTGLVISAISSFLFKENKPT